MPEAEKQLIKPETTWHKNCIHPFGAGDENELRAE